MKNALPKIPGKQTKVLQHLLAGITPEKASNHSERGRPATLTSDKKEFLVNALQNPDISYTLPGLKDQVYIGIEKKSYYYMYW